VEHSGTRYSSQIDKVDNRQIFVLVQVGMLGSPPLFFKADEQAPHAVMRRLTTMKEVETTSIAEGRNTRRRQSRSTMRSHEQRNGCGQQATPGSRPHGLDLRDLDRAGIGHQSHAAATTGRRHTARPSHPSFASIDDRPPPHIPRFIASTRKCSVGSS
jgi:hypothetical protein